MFKDPSCEDGDACREDGTLKDASEMEWLNSPSDIQKSKKREELELSDSELEAEVPKAKVRCWFFEVLVVIADACSMDSE